MKKLFIFFITVITLTISSCDSKDDNTIVPPIKTLKATIDGNELIFDTFKVDKIEDKDEEGNPYTDLIVTATKTSDASKVIVFNFEYLETGDKTCYFFSYNDGEKVFVYNLENKSFVINISENVVNKIKGTFTGTIPEEDGISTILISNGSFEINY